MIGLGSLVERAAGRQVEHSVARCGVVVKAEACGPLLTEHVAIDDAAHDVEPLFHAVDFAGVFV